MNYLEHTLYDNGIMSVCLVNDQGDRHRYCLAPGDSTDGEPAEVVAAASEAWTDGVIAAYNAALQAGD